MRNRSIAVPRLRPLPLLLVVVALLLVAPRATAGFGVLSVGGDFTPPTADGTALEDFTSDRIGFAFWVDQRGVYTLDSQRAQEDFAGRVLLHRGPIDEDQPLDRLITVADYVDDLGVTFDVLLEAGVVYYVSVTHAEAGPHDIHDFTTNVIAGPGQSYVSGCLPPGDESETIDGTDSLSLLDEFCVEVEWRDHQGNTGRGTVVDYRSSDSGMFWFFNRDNWEILVKVLDGCGVNGHYWVFFSATTDVGFTLYVTPREGGYDESGRVYSNTLGQTAATVTDAAAFDCDTRLPPGSAIE